nr:MAG: putative RNA-dependent RNA polymerase [Botourmiaviridae sp.]
MFPYGWDREYESFVNSHIPNATSRLSGERADLIWSTERGGGNIRFRRECMTGRIPDTTFRARYKEVLSAGKVRPLLIYDEKIDLLGPLHKMLYKHLCNQDWLLVGPPTEKRISSVCVGEYQTSIDLVSATDGLSLPVTDAILGSLLSKASNVPGRIKLLAFSSLSPLVEGTDGTTEVTHGQMMGAYLSFPLLCLQSYLAALWASRGLKAKILVNGDDTLISSSLPIESSWYPVGFRLNDTKTIRAKNVAEINSTAFLRGKGGKWRLVRHLRRGGFLTDYPGMLHAAAACRDNVAWTDAFIRSRIGKKWGFLPSQLGLHPKSYPSFCREREMCRRRLVTTLPEAPSCLDTSLLAVRRKLDPDERLATTFHILDNGRGGERKRDVFSPSVGEIRRGYRYRKVPLRYALSFLSGCLGGLKAMALLYRHEEEMRFVPAEYISRKEMEAVRSLRRVLVDC